MLSPSLRWVRIAAVALATGLCANAARVESGDVFAKWLNGADGFAKAMDARRGTSDALLLYFYTDWCPYCRRLNNEILSSDVAQQYIEHVVAVRINPEHGEREKAISDTYGVTGYPSVFVLPPGADQPRKISPYRKQGDDWVRMTPAEFVEACEAAGRKPRERTGPAPTVRRKSPGPVPPATATAPASPPFSPTHPVTLYLRNGGVITGDLVNESPEAVTLGLEYGEVVFQRAEIQRLEKGSKAGSQDTPKEQAEPSAVPSRDQ